MHCDLWGPTHVAYSQLMRYYMVFVNDNTRYTWLYPEKNKSESFEVFLKFGKMAVDSFLR